MNVRTLTEFEINCLHKPGALARVMDLMAKGGINIMAFCGYGKGTKANLYFVPDDGEKAEKILKGAKIKFTTASVISVTCASGPGEGARLSRLMADARVNILFTYASTGGSGDSTVILGVKDKDLDKTLKVLY